LKNLFFLAVAIALLFPAYTSAVSIHCISVGPNGEDTITWDTNGTLPADFRSWHIWYSGTAVGPYALIDSVNFFAATNYIHVTANAGTLPAYYFITFESNNGTAAVSSDTVRAIGVNVNNFNGAVNLSWNPTDIPNVITNSPYYLIYRKYPGGIFTLVDSVDARTAPVPMNFSDIITKPICDDTIEYFIRVTDSSGCISQSAIKKDRFIDLYVPSIPVIDSVSVDNAGNAVVAWQVSTTADTRSYVILQNPGPVAVDTVFGQSSTSYSTTISAVNTSLSFVIIAVDSCNNPSAYSAFHSTIFLRTSFDLCSQSATLNWTPYSFWGPAPSYDVFVSVNGAAETFIGNTSSTTFVDTNLTSGATMCYRVRAIESGGVRTSTSNAACFVPSFPPPPAYSYIRKVTVTGNGEVSIEASVDPVPTITGYDLYRSTVPSGPFEVVASLFISGVPSIIFSDNVPTDDGPYYYFIKTIDSCGFESINSQVSNTLLLGGEAYPDFTNSLHWNNYLEWPTGVDHYDIYLTINGNESLLPVFSVTNAQFAFVDSVLDSFISDGEFCYTIEAVEANGNPSGFLDTVRSNEVCLKQTPVIFIPNAFHPGGVYNEIFYPSNAFVSATDYTFDIFNRWGENVFHTTNPTAGWDGTTKGHQEQEAIYIYRLKAKNPDGTDIEKVGSVTLIR
jgi:gliding motility-associated-like protein